MLRGMTYSKPFLANEPRNIASSNTFYRAITALALAKIGGEDPEDIVQRAWGRDETLSTIIKAAVTPLSTTTGSTLTGIAHTTLLTGLSQGSAAAKLFSECVRLDFDGFNQVVVPVVATSVPPIFVAEGNPSAMIQ
jgi:hypothetical protein